jgi:hypothetical protein
MAGIETQNPALLTDVTDEPFHGYSDEALVFMKCPSC